MLGINNIKKIHFIGVGGAGMSGIAEILLNMKYTISGSDSSPSNITKRLEKLGLDFFNSHSEKNLKDVDLVVFSSAIKENNPELLEAIRKNIKVIQRAEMLAFLSELKKSIIFSGSHGKTTTTCITAHIFNENHLDPTYIIGGKVSSFESNAKLGNGKHILAEADESDRSFLLFNPDKAVVTSIDNDHLESYRNSFQNLVSAFIEFIKKVKNKTFVHDHVISLLPDFEIKNNIFSYGFEEKSDYQILNYSQNDTGSSFELKNKIENITFQFNVKMFGKHNILNAVAAIILSLDEGIEYQDIQKSLNSFPQVERRFEIINKNVFLKRIILIDDYGHHPTELINTIKTIKEVWPKKEIVMAFQPHRYSRTKALFNEFVEVLSKVDNLILLEIYPASEMPIEKYSSEDLFKEVNKLNKNITLVNGIDEAFFEFNKFKDEKYIFLTQGAGNTSLLASKFK